MGIFVGFLFIYLDFWCVYFQQYKKKGEGQREEKMSH
jgi:hypothetical protein